VQFRRSPEDEEVLAFVDRWIDELASDNYEAAYASSEHDPYYQWTPALMRVVVEGYGLPEPHRSGVRFRVTPRQSACGNRGEYRIDWSGQGRMLGWVYSSLPLNGEWSDLTVSFRIETRELGAVAILEEIHVF
jgi:hypothetical protein